jgi:hypothetical protein
VASLEPSKCKHLSIPVKVKLENVHVNAEPKHSLPTVCKHCTNCCVFCSVTHCYKESIVMSYNTCLCTSQDVLEIFPSSAGTFSTFEQILGHTLSCSLHMHFLSWKKNQPRIYIDSGSYYLHNFTFSPLHRTQQDKFQNPLRPIQEWDMDAAHPWLSSILLKYQPNNRGMKTECSK